MATKIKKTEAAGTGAGLQLLGVALALGGLMLGSIGAGVGIVSGLLLLVYGGMRANVQVCSECRGAVEKEARRCPHCRAEFE